jgi:hypothetical protein
MLYPITDPAEFCKRVLAGEPTAYTRPDLLAEMQRRAAVYHRPDVTAEQALAKFLMTDEDGRALYAAYRVLPNPAPEPVTKRIEPAPSPSLAALNKLADDLRNREPSLSAEMAFTKVYSDPRNRRLVAAERDENRPPPTHQ